MNCIVCGKNIQSHETRDYVVVYRNEERSRKLYACGNCCIVDGAFDRLIDSLPTDENGNLQDVSHAEIAALLVAADPKKLERRLRDARSALRYDVKKRFGRGQFDFENRRLIGDNGLALQWKTRAMPDKPVAYLNQQTTIGYVDFQVCDNPSTCES